MFKVPSFYDAEAETHNIIQQEFGENLIIRPQKSRPNYSASPDPNRPPFTLTAIFSWESKNINLQMNETYVTSRDPKIHVHRCDLPYPVVKGDQVYRCRTGDLFEIVKNEPDSYSGICFELVQLGVQD